MWYERARDWVLLRRWPWLLSSHEPALRLQALNEMATTRRSFTPDLLVPLLADRDDPLAERAWRLLCEWGDGAREALRRGLASPALKVREQAAQALGHLGDADDLPALRAAARDPLLPTRAVARRAILRIERRATASLTPALRRRRGPPRRLARSFTAPVASRVC